MSLTFVCQSLINKKTKSEATFLSTFDDCTENFHDNLGNTDQFFDNGETCDITHPVTKKIYRIQVSKVSSLLEQKGTLKTKVDPNSDEIKKLIEKFCDAKTINFCTQKDAENIIDSGYKVETIALKSNPKKQKTKEQYECFFCPLIQNCRKFFPVKENLKRHNCKHLRYTRFNCEEKGCEFASYRHDHLMEHLEKKHGQIPRKPIKV